MVQLATARWNVNRHRGPCVQVMMAGTGWHGTTSQRWFGGGVSRYFWLTPSVCSTLISSAMVATAVIDSHHYVIYDLFSLLMF